MKRGKWIPVYLVWVLVHLVVFKILDSSDLLLKIFWTSHLPVLGACLWYTLRD